MTIARAIPVTIRKALLDARRALPSDDTKLDAEVLLMHTLGIDRARLYQRLREPLTGEDTEVFATLLARLQTHEPLAYITGHREFFALDFEVTPAALIPRAETETLVELVIAFARDRFAGQPLTIADIGTGSGIVAVSLATSLSNARIIATDISLDALALAHRNAERHTVSNRIDFDVGDLLTPINTHVQIIVANLPYVTTKQWKTAPSEIRDHEPRLALDGGPDGLDVIRRLIAEAPALLAESGALFCEIGDWQGEAAKTIAEKAYPNARVDIVRDLAGRNRVLTVAPG